MERIAAELRERGDSLLHASELAEIIDDAIHSSAQAGGDGGQVSGPVTGTAIQPSPSSKPAGEAPGPSPQSSTPAGTGGDAASNSRLLDSGKYSDAPPSSPSGGTGGAPDNLNWLLSDMDAAKWAAEFRKMAVKLGYSDMDESWLVTWFSCAIMTGFDEHARRHGKDEAKLAAIEEAAAKIGFVTGDTKTGEAKLSYERAAAFNLLISKITGKPPGPPVPPAPIPGWRA